MGDLSLFAAAARWTKTVPSSRREVQSDAATPLREKFLILKIQLTLGAELRCAISGFWAAGTG